MSDAKNKDMLRISVADGKYTVVQDASGKLKALRNGEPWRDCVGDGLILALAYELEEAREQRAGLLKALKKAEIQLVNCVPIDTPNIPVLPIIRAAIAKAEWKETI